VVVRVKIIPTKNTKSHEDLQDQRLKTEIKTAADDVKQAMEKL
jgi:hypothetical protein